MGKTINLEVDLSAAIENAKSRIKDKEFLLISKGCSLLVSSWKTPFVQLQHSQWLHPSSWVETSWCPEKRKKSLFPRKNKHKRKVKFAMLKYCKVDENAKLVAFVKVSFWWMWYQIFHGQSLWHMSSDLIVSTNQKTRSCAIINKKDKN